MRLDIRLILVLVVVTMTYLMEVESRRHHKSKHSGKVAADAVMRSWQRMLKKMRGPTYKYWHRRQDANGDWHERKYGNSDSYSGSSSRSSESGSRSTSGSKESSSSSSRRHHGRKHRGGGNGHPVAAETFILFGNSYGCNNVSAYQHFLASYTTGEGRAEKLRIDPKREHDELLKEMSKLAAEDLAKGGGDNDNDKEPTPAQDCSQTCPASDKSKNANGDGDTVTSTADDKNGNTEPEASSPDKN